MQCDWAEKCQIQAFYVICSGANHYCGGTSHGRCFLEANPLIPAEFLSSMHEKGIQLPCNFA